MWTILKIFIEFFYLTASVFFFFMFWFFGHKVCEILVPRAGTEAAFPALEGEVLPRLPGKSLLISLILTVL